MTLIFEVVLTVVAYKRGWKWIAILPVGICIIIALGIGFVGGLTGCSLQTLIPYLISLDIMTILALIWMSIKKRQLPETEVTN